MPLCSARKRCIRASAGTAKPSVLPDPVCVQGSSDVPLSAPRADFRTPAPRRTLAMQMPSPPISSAGQLCAWMGVGLEKLLQYERTVCATSPAHEHP